MNLLGWVPWVRAYGHAEAAFREERALNTIAMLTFTSLPVVAAYAWIFNATWLFASSLTALFLITLGDLNTNLVATYLFDVPLWLCEKGFRRSVVTKDDGSCFFDAVRIALGKTEQEVREEIANWIDKHKCDDDVQATYQDQAGTDTNYTQRLRNGDLGLWGNTLEAIAVSKSYNRKVTLYSKGAAPLQFEGDEPAIELYFTASSVNGCANHYRLLKRSFLNDWMRF